MVVHCRRTYSFLDPNFSRKKWYDRNCVKVRNELNRLGRCFSKEPVNSYLRKAVVHCRKTYSFLDRNFSGRRKKWYDRNCLQVKNELNRLGRCFSKEPVNLCLRKAVVHCRRTYSFLDPNFSGRRKKWYNRNWLQVRNELNTLGRCFSKEPINSYLRKAVVHRRRTYSFLDPSVGEGRNGMIETAYR